MPVISIDVSVYGHKNEKFVNVGKRTTIDLPEEMLSIYNNKGTELIFAEQLKAVIKSYIESEMEEKSED